MNTDFIKQRIEIFCGMPVDPNIDNEVIDVLQRKFNIFLPQRSSLDKSLEDATSDHEVIRLIAQYRIENKI